MTTQDAMKSIILGLTMKTNDNSIKWMNDDEWNIHLKRDPKIWERKESLSLSYYLILDKDTQIQLHMSISSDHSKVDGSFINIKNDNLQNGEIGANSYSTYCTQEYKDLVDLMFKKYVQPKILTYKKNYQSDIDCLTNIVGLCGIESVRDMKLNSILDKRGWIDKLFN